MKKTLVAIAAAAAVTGAMADVTISGAIDQAYTTTSVDGTESTTIGGRGYGAGTAADSQLTFTGSEDLGDGLVAKFKADMGISPNAASFGTANKEAWVGLSGGFGNVQIGTNYNPGFMNFLMMGDPLGANNNYGNLVMVHFLNDAVTYSIGGSSSVLYESPAFNGASFQLYKQYSTTAGSTTGNGTGFSVRYMSGPLAVSMASDSITGSTNSFMGTDGDLSALANTVAAVAGTDRKSTMYAASYDFGVAKLWAAGNSSNLSGVADSKITANSVSITVPLGALTLAYTASSANFEDTSISYSGTQMGATYALSKRTSAYVLVGIQTDKDDSSNELKQTSIGIRHAF